MFNVYLKCQSCQWRREIFTKCSGCTINLRYAVRLLASLCGHCHNDIGMMLEIEEVKEEVKE